MERFRIIHSHPTTRGRWFAAVMRTFSWIFAWKILRLQKLVFPYLERSELIAPTGTIGCAGAYVCSLYEYEDMSFLLHFLREGDLFFDVGANIGWFTVLAASERRCRVVAFEPIPKTFSSLKTNVALNEIEELVTLRNVGVGKEEGMLAFTSDKDVENCVAVSVDDVTIQVPVATLDIQVTVASKEDSSLPNYPIAVKIDVEGFETSVLAGAERILDNKELRVLLVELVGHGVKYGFDENALRRQLNDKGFQAYTYDPRRRELRYVGDDTTQNTLFIRDFDFVQDRIAGAIPFRLFGRDI